jgi:hypothetical protein
MATMSVAVVIFLILVSGALLFQISVMAGAPFGHLTMGGFYKGVLPAKIRGLVAVSASLLLLCAVLVLTRAGWIFTAWLEVSRGLIWGVVGYLGLGVVQHVFTPSHWERVVWLPQLLVMWLCAVLIALG